MSTTSIRPPFTRETALAKVQAAEDAWNSRDPGRVALAYSEDSMAEVDMNVVWDTVTGDVKQLIPQLEVLMKGIDGE